MLTARYDTHTFVVVAIENPYFSSQGNPLALVPKYRTYVVHWMPGLLSLDDAEVSPEERDAAGNLPPTLGSSRQMI